MKIALLYLDALRPGGYPRDVRWLASALARKGHEVSLIVRSGRETDGLEGVEVVAPRRFASLRSSLDVIHSWGLFVPMQMAVDLMERKRGREVSTVISPLAQLMPLHIGRSPWKKIPYLALLRPTLKRWKQVAHFFSEEEYWASLQYLEPRAHFEASMGLFPTGAGSLDGPGDYFLFFGRNDITQKGLDVLIEGYRHALRQGNQIPLLIAGHSERGSAAYWRSVARDPELSPFIELVGEVTEDVRTRLLQRARCLVFPSRWDGPPRPVREAIALGTPVIVTNGTNMGKLVETYDAGALAALEPSSIADSLLEATDLPTVTRWRGGVADLRERLSWERVADDYLAGYDLALQS